MRKHLSRIYVAASIAFALALTFSCSSDGGGSDSGGGSGGGGGNSSSSSDADEHCNEAPLIKLPPCSGEPVEIGEQIWQKCNLDVLPSTGDHSCYLNNPENCKIYGRLYNWSAAMALPDKCNFIGTSANADCEIKTPYHQGICPDGWHIPSAEDWEELLSYFDANALIMESHLFSSSLIAGWHLKAKSGWNENGNGGDTHDFSALPGGIDKKDFCDIGYKGMWWSSTEYESSGVGLHFALKIRNIDGYAVMNFAHDWHSIRCLKD